MKKLIVFFILVMVLFYVNQTKQTFTLTDYFTGEYITYSSIPASESSISLGFCHLNYNAKSSSTIGESITISDFEISSAIKTLKANIIKSEYLGNGTTVIYAYSPLINTYVSLENKKVNLQIALTDNKTTIGWPLILGSF